MVNCVEKRTGSGAEETLLNGSETSWRTCNFSVLAVESIWFCDCDGWNGRRGESLRKRALALCERLVKYRLCYDELTQRDQRRILRTRRLCSQPARYLSSKGGKDRTPDFGDVGDSPCCRSSKVCRECAVLPLVIAFILYGLQAPLSSQQESFGRPARVYQSTW